LTGTVMGKNASGDELVGWLYVDKDTSQKCIKKVEILTKEILSYRGNLTPENQEKAIKAIAKVHWWMIHSIAFNGGTAGMSDLLTKTLFDTIGMETSPWKKGAVPDIEVFVRSMDDYVNHYTSFFQYPPRLKK
ncbi:MAG: hypothetical protein K2X66_14690, partial [Cyanobacteria bacterium]|nr:hypothetical protein [Cyanobacteriota bacterium]